VFGLTVSQILGLSVIAALVTTVGNLLATWLKEFLFARSFERWKARQALLTAYRKYRDPIIMAATELQARVGYICKHYPTNFLQSFLLELRPRQMEVTSDDDQYFMKYRLVSTAYRLCALLGWLELYRQEVTFLDTGKKKSNERLEIVLEKIRADLADGQLNPAPDFFTWNDRLIFREEQRAIGEKMITDTNLRVVMGYGAFHALFDNARTNDELWWVRVAYGFILDLADEKDFRRQRLEWMDEHLGEVISLLKH
jgi:hypothetical protein